MPGTTSRISRVNEHIRTLLAATLRDEIEFDPGVVVTVTKVTTSKDIAHATVSLMIFPDAAQITTLQLVQARAKTLRHKIAIQSKLFRVPQFRFIIDHTEEQGQHMDAVLDKLT
jgi:ribosome-binding factor A